MKHASLAALALCCCAALAQSGPGNFVCGGISQPEAEAMKAQARDHALMLTFAQAGGAYLADVAVRISDRRGNVVVSGTCEGPIMLVDLAPGTWKVQAQVNGLERQATVTTARGRTARATLLWPDDRS